VANSAVKSTRSRRPAGPGRGRPPQAAARSHGVLITSKGSIDTISVVAGDRAAKGKGIVGATVYAGDVSLIVHLPEELARRVEAIAEARRQTPEQVAVEAIETALPARRRLSFAGIGSSAPPGGDIARRHREIRAEAFADKSARDV
jgi:fructose-specific component phosphotransferase system IIB-like protein